MKRCVILMRGWRIAVPNKRELTARSSGVVRPIIICGLAGVFLALALNATAQTAPPKSIKDLVAQLEAAPPQPERIAELKATLAEPFPAQAPPTDQISFLRRQARAAEELGQTGRELELKRRNAELARGTPEAPRILMDLATRERVYGDYTRSIQLIEELVRLSPSAGFLISVYGRLAGDRVVMADLPGAEEAMRQAEQAYQKSMSNPRGAAWYRHIWRSVLECGRGNYLSLRGKLAEADAAYRLGIAAAIDDAALAERRFAQFGNAAPTPDVSNAARDGCELNYARTLMQGRRHVAAEVMLREQLRRVIGRVGRDSPQVASALGALGGVYSRQGRYADAEVLLAEAVRIYERAGAEDGSVLVARTRGEYAQALYVRGDYAGAVAQVERWTGDPARNPAQSAAYLMAMAAIGQGARALPLANGQLQRVAARFGSNHVLTGHSLGAKAMALHAGGAKTEALELYRDAVRVIADARKRSSDDGDESLFKRIFGQILESYLLLLFEMQGAEFAARFPVPPAVEGLRVSDMLRAGSVQRALAASAARASSDQVLAETVRREQDLGEEAATLLRTLPSLLSAPPERQLGTVIADMRKRIDTLRNEQTKLVTEIERRFPAYANLVAPKAPTLAETQGALRDGEALLTIFVGETTSFVWAVPKSGAPVFHAAGAGKREIEALAAKVRRTVDPFSHGLPGVPPFALDEAHELYRLLVAPVARGIDGARQVIVTTNGALAALPFALMPTAKTDVRLDQGDVYAAYRAVPWLARKYAISQVPSVNALVTLRALPVRADKTASFAGVGDPVFSRAQMNDTVQSEAGVTVRGGARIALRSAGRLDQVDSAELGRLARLPDTAEEIRSIAAIFGAGSDVLLREQANEKAIKARDWRNRRIVMFATHGLVPGELNGLDQPALALTAPDVAGGEGDGLLTVEEILNLKLDADWVVLSACNTASGSEAGAEALSGLGRAFFFAGTRALLASNWPVETVSARLITTGIFQRQVKDAALSKSEVLQATLLDLIDNGTAKDAAGKVQYSYAHPLFWAPFALVGDGR